MVGKSRRAYKKTPKRKAVRIGICAGCYTVFTAQHVRYLEEARSTCDYLIALTNFDDYIYEKKGCVPIGVEERLEILRSFRVVDEAFAFEGDNEESWIARFKNSRLSEFAEGAKIILYHDQSAMIQDGKIKAPEDVVGFGIADGLRMVGRKDGTSVSDVFNSIIVGNMTRMADDVNRGQ